MISPIVWGYFLYGIIKHMSINDFIQKSITKKFSVRAKGYDPQDVDTYFDTLIFKIKELAEQNAHLQQEVDNLNSQVTELQKEKENLNSVIAAKEKLIEELNKSGFHNEAMARRISELEQKFDKKEEK